jgi:hypothetical protein
MLTERIVVSESLTVPLDGIAKTAPGFDVSVFDQYLRAVRWRQYKLILSTKHAVELYDVEVDREEKKDLVQSLPQVASEMQGKLHAWLDSFEPYQPLTGLAADLEDEKILERLRDLGYLE